MSPVRALLTSHFQTGWNRAIREMGRNGTVALVIVSLCIGVFVLLPMTAGLGFAGYVLGRSIYEPWAPAMLGAIFTAAAFGGGLTGGILGGAKTLDWERLRGFPLSRGQILGAELVAGLGDLLTMMFALGLAFLSLGLIIAQPLRAPFALLLLLASLVILLTVQLLVGGLATTALRHLKSTLLVLLSLVWISSVAMGSLWPKNASRESRTTVTQVQPFDEARLRALGDRLQYAAEILPATQSAHGLGDAGLLKSSLRQLPILALAGLLVWLSASLLWRESAQDGQTLAISDGQAKLWSFSRPAYGLARLQWRTLTGSMIGRFAFITPLVIAAILTAHNSSKQGQEIWVVPSGFIYLAFGAGHLLFNQFGLDQGGVKVLLLLPIKPRELLFGKSLGFGLFLGVQVAILSMFLVLRGGANTVSLVPAGLLLFFSCVMAMGSVGQWSSIAMPRSSSRKRMNEVMPFATKLLYLGTGLGVTLLFGGYFVLLAWAAPQWLLPGMTLMLGAMLLVVHITLEKNAGFLSRNRERLAEHIGWVD